MAMRFNPPPGWPPAPTGWIAPPDWQPDPSWPEPPPGWRLWIEDRSDTAPEVRNSWLGIAAGSAIVLGSQLPFVSFNDMDAQLNPAAKTGSLLFGLIIIALAVALRLAPQAQRLVAGIVTLGLSALGALGYVLFIVIGIVGVPEQDPFGDTATLRFSPGIGIVFCVAGCVVAGLAAIRSGQHRQG
jgi:hypothetical protein